jgi:type VI secretion system protein ImpC
MSARDKRRLHSDKTAEQAGRIGLNQIVDQGLVGADPASRDRGKSQLKEFVSQVLEGQVTISKDTEAMINARVAQIDHLVSIQLNEILRHPQFQELEASWRGLKYLTDHVETGTRVKIRILNVSKGELKQDLEEAPELDYDGTFKRICEENFGYVGGAAVIVGDYEFAWNAEDFVLLDKISRAAAAAHALFLTATTAGPWNARLNSPENVAQALDSCGYARWANSFLQREHSRYLGLCLPRLLLRLPWEPEGAMEGLTHEFDESKCLWGNGAYAVAAMLVREFALHFHGKPSGTVERRDELTPEACVLDCQTDITFDERTAEVLSNFGFLPLATHKSTRLSALVKALQDQATASGMAGFDFFAERTIQDLAQSQGVKPMTDIRLLAGDWPELETLDQMVEEIYRDRKTSSP